MWRAAASLERLDVKHKEPLGAGAAEAAAAAARRRPTRFWALTRLGARVLLYGPLNAVVHPQVVAGVARRASCAFEPGHDSERLAWAFCLAQLARRSGQRALDVDDSHRAERADGAARPDGAASTGCRWSRRSPSWRRDEQSQMFGEALPIGLRLDPHGRITFIASGA